MSPARRLLEDRIGRLSDDLDTLFNESRDRARREHAEQLNQAVRRLRIAADPEELFGTIEHAAAQFAGIALRRASCWRREEEEEMRSQIRTLPRCANNFWRTCESKL